MKNLVFSLLLSSSAVLAAARPGSRGASKVRGTSAADTQFFDFRNIPSPRVPAPIEDFAQSQEAGCAHEYFQSAEWTNAWSIQSWGKLVTDTSPTRMTNSRNNVYIQQNTDAQPESSTFLTMRTVRHGDFQSSSELESIRTDYQYVTVTMYARTVGDAGACTAMFTYLGPSGQSKVQEADLEILTKEANNVAHYTNQPSYDAVKEYPEATREVTLATSWDTWQEHKLVWTPESSDWFVNGEKVASIQFQTPVSPTQVIFNSWSDGGEWSGNMRVGGSAEMQIQWIRIEQS